MKRQLQLPASRKWMICAVLLVVAAFALGYWSAKPSPETHRTMTANASPSDAVMPATLVTDAMTANHDHAPQETVDPGASNSDMYVCPMMCTAPLDAPGRCPVCGMELTAVEGDGLETQHDHMSHGVPPVQGDWSGSRIFLRPQAMKLAEVRLAPVERKAARTDIRLFGQIDYDPAHMTKLSAFMPGVIDRVYVKRAGQFVRWGDPLFDLFSTDLQDTQKQLIELMPFVPSFLAFQSGQPHVAQEVPVQNRVVDNSEAGVQKRQAAGRKIAAIRHKLSILGLPKRDIDELMKVGEATGIATVYASMYGQVVEQNAYEGNFVNRGTTIITLADPKYVWANLDAYEADYPWLRKGQEVTFTTTAYPGERFKAKVVYIDPVFNPKTRTFRVGALLSEQGGRLKAGMLIRSSVMASIDAEGQVIGDNSRSTKPPLVIPATAPLITGQRAVVYVAVPDQTGHFEGREVVLGPKAQDHYIVLKGLEEGEHVVAHGNFKIDSAIQILARKSMMDLPDGELAEGRHLHGGSAAMNADYLDDRLRSRMPRQADASADGQEGEGEASTFVRSRRPTPRHGQSVVQRRRPGAYGDTTRRSTRGLSQ